MQIWSRFITVGITSAVVTESPPSSGEPSQIFFWRVEAGAKSLDSRQNLKTLALY
ncbi:hypothetical protein [Calothrix sp. PCC 6303]|uniref:hypothetical protein n=1 Tax=Calothrix sp. PCC 6303 TaxID=1170562 RepID=UPI0003113BC2|nr:hypothetical protein [Calothrix sp. PCC 6303]